MEINPGTKVLIKYSQDYMEQVLDDEYITYVNSYEELQRIVDALYDDPHVFMVDWMVIK